MSDLVKREFVKRELSKYARRVNELFFSSINQMHLIDKGGLRDGIQWEFQGEDYGDGTVRFTFPAYGRFVDMGAGNGYQNGAIVEDGRHNANFYKGGRKKKRKPKKWYTKNVYRALGGLYYGLSTGYTDAVKATIKQEVERGLDKIK